MALPDHNDHIHVGFKPRFGANSRTGKEAEAVLKPGQWGDLLSRLRKIRNPVVPTKPSRYALPVPRRRRHKRAHGSSVDFAPPPRRGGVGRVPQFSRPPAVPPSRRLKPVAEVRTLKPLRALGR
jgi:hypothetical protein